MANAKQEMKELAKAIDIITGFRVSEEAMESPLVMGILNDAELNWRRRYMDLQQATARKPAKKAIGDRS